MKNILFLVLCSAFFVKANAQKVLTINDLSFNDGVEKRAFFCLKKNNQNADSILWVHCISYQNEAAFAKIVDYFEPIIQKATKDELSQKNIKAQEKWLHKNILEIAFKSYSDIATLSDFSQNKFNKSTATILLTYFFEKANLPYVLTTEANQLDIYIGNFDNKQNIGLQSTKYNVNNYVEALKMLDLVGEENLMTQSNDDLYKQLKGREAHQISFKEAIADVYLKKTLQNIQSQSFEEALIALNKSIFLQKEVWKDDLKGFILIKLSERVKANDFKSFQPLFELAYYAKYAENSKGALFEEFNDQTVKNLVTDINIEKQYQMLNYFLKEFEHDEEIVKQIKITHYSYCVDSYLYQGKKEQALKFADTVFTLAPRNVKLQSDFADVILRDLTVSSNLYIDPVNFLKNIDELKLRFSFLKENVKFNLLLQIGEAIKIAKCLENDKNAECVKEFYTFKENNYEKMKETNPKACEEVFTKLYSSLCAYYFQISEFKKGNEVLEEGLKLFPNDEELKGKHNSYKEEFESGKDIKVEYAKPNGKYYGLYPPLPPPPLSKTKKKN